MKIIKEGDIVRRLEASEGKQLMSKTDDTCAGAFLYMGIGTKKSDYYEIEIPIEIPESDIEWSEITDDTDKDNE